MVKMLVLLVSCLIIVGGIGLLYGGIENTLEEPKILEQSIEYTPSQNLAILEGRFDDARESIKKMRGLNGNS